MRWKATKGADRKRKERALSQPDFGGAESQPRTSAGIPGGQPQTHRAVDAQATVGPAFEDESLGTGRGPGLRLELEDRGPAASIDAHSGRRPFDAQLRKDRRGGIFNAQTVLQGIE